MDEIILPLQIIFYVIVSIWALFNMVMQIALSIPSRHKESQVPKEKPVEAAKPEVPKTKEKPIDTTNHEELEDINRQRKILGLDPLTGLSGNTPVIPPLTKPLPEVMKTVPVPPVVKKEDDTTPAAVIPPKKPKKRRKPAKIVKKTVPAT